MANEEIVHSPEHAWWSVEEEAYHPNVPGGIISVTFHKSGNRVVLNIWITETKMHGEFKRIMPEKVLESTPEKEDFLEMIDVIGISKKAS